MSKGMFGPSFCVIAALMVVLRGEGSPSSGSRDTATSTPCGSDSRELVCRVDFGVTPDDFGNAHACPAVSNIDSQYVQTQSILFGAAVDFPGSGPRPPVEIVDDGACSPSCRSSGVPAYDTDWWGRFMIGAGPGVPGGPAGVDSVSAEFCFIEGTVSLMAYDAGGLVVDSQSSLFCHGPVQTVLVRDTTNRHRIQYIQVTASQDPGGVSVDCLSYDNPQPRPPCVCPCPGDPQCDPDHITNVQDVVHTVNVAFRGYAPVFDPDCPFARTDVDCDHVTTVVDVVWEVNVAFRASLTPFCDPCSLPCL